MTDTPMLTTEQLKPWGLYPQATIDAVVQQVRARCEWHIAPEVTETLTLDARGADYIMLPSLRVVEVTAVRVWDDAARALVPATGWSLRTGWSANGMLYRPGGWPDAFRAVEVDLRHGYAEAPADLAKMVAERTERRVVQESLQGHSLTYSDDAASYGLESPLDAYRIPLEP